jgi:anhydro-N-acetylmuramic acid kinase
MLAIGLMSGTSMDGVDVALLDTDGEQIIQTRGHISLSYDPAFQALLKSAEHAFYLNQGNHLAADHYLQSKHNITLDNIIERSTEWHQKAIEQLLAQLNISRTTIDIIGYHGQTLFHNPSAGLTVQVGNSQYLANTFGVPVVSHFRQNDIEHGGQGAPLAPLYHQALAVRDQQYPIAIVNCGGIANITLITGPLYEDIYAFDTGPGNALIDRYLKQQTAGQVCMDKDGQYGLHGNIHAETLSSLFEKSCICQGKNYFILPPPKSLDINDLQLIPELNKLSINDACATLAAFTAQTIIDSVVRAELSIPTIWVIAGGGAKNPVICRELLQKGTEITSKKISVKTADEMSWNAQGMEAELFAWLAVRSLKQLPLSIPQTTGVSQPISGGSIFRPET